MSEQLRRQCRIAIAIVPLVVLAVIQKFFDKAHNFTF